MSVATKLSTTSRAATALQHPVITRNRPSVEGMTPTQLADFRRAVTGAMGIYDNRGWWYQAGIHGLPLPISCQHHNPLFLPWHRAYLYYFELALQDRVAGISIPWWDWTSAGSHQIGIPAAYTDPSNNNPLTGSDIDPVAVQQAQQAGLPDAPSHTDRSPGSPSQLPTTSQVNNVLALADFSDFTTQLESIHDNVHVWVGGTMAEIPLAAYDPVFWAHHTMIDRLWRLWQLRHPTAGVPASLLNEALPPFPMTVKQTLSVTALGYDYAQSVIRIPPRFLEVNNPVVIGPGPDPGPLRGPAATQTQAGGA